MRQAAAYALKDRQGDALEAGSRAMESFHRDLADDRYSVVSVTDLARLRGVTAAWEELAARALEPSPGYEQWMLGAAMEYLAGDTADPESLPFDATQPDRLRHSTPPADGRIATTQPNRLRYVLVYAPSRSRSAEPLLCGVFPLEQRSRHFGFPFRTLRLWRHRFCQYGVPLIRASHARETLEAFFSWLGSAAHGCLLFELNQVPGEGPFHHLLVEYLDRQSMLHNVGDCFGRPILRPAGDADSYLSDALSRAQIKLFEQHEKELRLAGKLEYDLLQDGGDVRSWLAEFLALEANGRTADGGNTAVATWGERAFLAGVAAEAFRLGRLRTLALRLDGRMIAARIAIGSPYALGRAEHTLQTVSDRSYARYSPGQLLEIENIRRVHRNGDCDRVDWVTPPDDTGVERLWRDRLLVRDCVVGTGSRRGDLVASSLGLMRWLKRRQQRPGPAEEPR